MTVIDESDLRNRNRNYEETHRQLIESAGEMIARRGAGAVSISAVARATGINRSTVYYHFDTREALLLAAQPAPPERSAAESDPDVSRWAGIDQIAGFFRRDTEVLTSWIENHLAVGDVRQRYPHWDRLVAKIGNAFAELASDEPCDPEFYCALMLASAFSVPRVFTSSAHPFESLERLLERLHAKAAAHAGR